MSAYDEAEKALRGALRVQFDKYADPTQQCFSLSPMPDIQQRFVKGRPRYDTQQKSESIHIAAPYPFKNTQGFCYRNSARNLLLQLPKFVLFLQQHECGHIVAGSRGRISGSVCSFLLALTKEDLMKNLQKKIDGFIRRGTPLDTVCFLICSPDRGFEEYGHSRS